MINLGAVILVLMIACVFVAKECKPEDKRPMRNGWAPGWYIGECTVCHDCYEGDKRSTMCADCAYNLPIDDSSAKKTLKDVREKRLREWGKAFVSDWIADLAAIDQGRVFWKDTPDEAMAPVTYGDLRKLMRQNAEINEGR